MWNAVWNILTELSPWLLLGTLVAGLMQLLIPASRLQRMLRGRGKLLSSVIVGIPLPLCSCSVIPVGIGLRKQGASRGASLGFLISTPQTGVDSILVSGSMLGWPFAMFKVAAALVMGVIGGGLAEQFGQDATDEEDSDSDRMDAEPNQQAFSKRVNEALLHSIELIRSIWRWLVFGLLVSATISWLLPANELSGFAGTSGLAAMLITLIVSIPLYVCATASVPIAAALVGSGLPVGAAMVFLMAGPATNLATLGAVYRTFGTRSTGLYLATMITGSVSAGLLFDSVLPAQTIQVIKHHHHVGGFAIGSSWIVCALIAWFAIEDLLRLRPQSGEDSDLVLQISGMHCENCAAGLERDFKAIAGVNKATVRFATEEARIAGKPQITEVLQIITDKGFTAQIAQESDTRLGKPVTD